MAKDKRKKDRAAKDGDDTAKAVPIAGEAPGDGTDPETNPETDPGADAAPAGVESESEPADQPADEAAGKPADQGALEAEIVALNDKLLRALAEVENVRRRAERDREDASKYAIAGFAREMLGVADNLKRALDSLAAEDQEKGAADPDRLRTQFERFVEGVKLTETEMAKTLERIGIEKVEPQGQPFDPNLHEAMFEVDDPATAAGTVMQVLEPGYVLKDRLLRPAKVGVAKGGPKSAEASAPAPGPEPVLERKAKPKEGRQAYEDKGKGPGTALDEEL